MSIHIFMFNGMRRCRLFKSNKVEDEKRCSRKYVLLLGQRRKKNTRNSFYFCALFMGALTPIGLRYFIFYDFIRYSTINTIYCSIYVYINISNIYYGLSTIGVPDDSLIMANCFPI